MTETGAAVVTMFDTIHEFASIIPADAPKVAGYVTGSPGVRWTAEDWVRFSGVKVGINQMPGSDPLLGDVFDVEPGAWTPAKAVQASRERWARGLDVTLYCSQTDATELVNACMEAGVTSGNLWVANWFLSEAEATDMVVHRHRPWPIQAVQWAGEAPYSLSVTAPGWPVR
jgi:hypothetical protein